MFSSISLLKNRCLVKNLSCALKPLEFPKVVNCPNVMCEKMRNYSKKKDKECRKALVDIPPELDPKCPEVPKPKKLGVLHKIKLKIIEGGTNFGTPFRRLRGQPVCKEPEEIEEEEEPPKALPAPVEEAPEVPEPRPGVQVSILGADCSVGQYAALLLKQCPYIKRLRLYQANESTPTLPFCRDLYQVVQDLQYINTNCVVQAYSCRCCELNLCLQSSDIVLMLDSAYADSSMSLEARFNYHAPMVKQYSDAIAQECPKAFVIVCVSPIDCMVPIVAETFKETGWYDRRKLLGSVAIPEMRASTLAARALALDPSIIKVPCVGGTEGTALVPLFSKAVDHFDFPPCNALTMTRAIRDPKSASCCLMNPDLSEAHALAGLVKSVAAALLCYEFPTVSGYVETDNSQIISPARFLSVNMVLNCQGIYKKYDIPAPCNDLEMYLLDRMWDPLCHKVQLALDWYREQYIKDCMITAPRFQTNWCFPKHVDHVRECNASLS